MAEGIHLRNKHAVRQRLSSIAEATPANLPAGLRKPITPTRSGGGGDPLNEMQGIDAIRTKVWGPLLHSFPDLERRDTILIGGHCFDTDLVGAVGHYCGTFRHDLADHSSDRPSDLHPLWRVSPDGGRKDRSKHRVDGRSQRDSPGGVWQIAPSLGTEEQWPCPITADGIVLTEDDHVQSAASLKLTLDMQASLGAYDDEAKEGRGAAEYATEGFLASEDDVVWTIRRRHDARTGGFRGSPPTAIPDLLQIERAATTMHE